MRRRPGLLAILVAALVAAIVAVVDLTVAPATPPPTPSAPTSVTPVAGTSTCAVGGDQPDTSLEAVLARPGGPGDPPAVVDSATFAQGELTPLSVPRLFPGTHATTRLTGADALGIFTRWEGGPVALQREWRLEGDEDLPPGTIAGGCPRAIASEWVVPGMTTTGGHEARLTVANPFRADAAIAVSFLTPGGREQPIALRNLSVPARGTIEIPVNDVLPEQDDLSAVVEVVSGRVAVEGYQLTRAAIGDVDGASLLTAAPEAAETWTAPWVVDGQGTASWLWIANRGDRPASVELTLHTEDGGVVPDGLAEVTVSPEQLRRVDLRGTLPEDVELAAITARSDGAPVYVAAAVELAPAAPEPEDEEEDADEPVDLEDLDAPATDVPNTGFAVQPASPSTDGTWVVTGGATDGREEQLVLANPGSEPAEVDVSLFNGITALQPDELQGVRVPAGSLRTVELVEHLGQVSNWSAFVSAVEGEVVVGRVGTGGEQALHLVATLGTPSTAWAPVTVERVGVFSPGVTRLLGTSLGITAPDPLAPPVPDEDPEEAPDDDPADTD